MTIHQKDLGFQLKGDDSTWVLYNWQTQETIRPVNERDSSRILDQGVSRDDGFSRLMAAVVNDTSVMYNTYTGHLFQQTVQLSFGHGSRMKGCYVINRQRTVNRQPFPSPNHRTQLPTATTSGQRPTANNQPSVG